jgi:hypothetical protein
MHLHLLQFSGLLTQVLAIAALLFQGFAFINSLIHPAAAYRAADKWTKPGWTIVTFLALLLVIVFGPISIFGVGGIVASIVYIVDVRPALREVSGGRGGSGGGNAGRW